MDEIYLQKLQAEECMVTAGMESRVLGALADRSVSRRQLSRATRLRAATVDAVVKSLAVGVSSGW